MCGLTDYKFDTTSEAGNQFRYKLSELFRPYTGLTVNKIQERLNPESKNHNNNLTHIAESMLHAHGCGIRELKNMGINLKIIKVNSNKHIIENFPICRIPYDEISSHEWKESSLYKVLSEKFLFLIFQRIDTIEYIFKGVKFWLLPENDINIIRGAWQDSLRIMKDDMSDSHDAWNFKLNSNYIEKEIIASFFDEIDNRIDEIGNEFEDEECNDSEFLLKSEMDDEGSKIISPSRVTKKFETKDYISNNTTNLISSIGEYCKNSNNEIITLLPNFLNTISNIFEDDRSDEYMKILCNMSFASFVLNGSKDDSNLLKTCFVSLKVLEQMLDDCDTRIVYENAISFNFINILTLNLEDYISKCSYLVKGNEALDEVGFNEFTLFFKDKYDWKIQQDERKMVEFNRIVMYVKFIDLYNEVKSFEIFNSEADYANALEHFSERGILLSESEVTPEKYRMLEYLNPKAADFQELEKSVIDASFSDIKANLSKKNSICADLKILDDMLLLIKHSYNSASDWEEKLLTNSVIAYFISPRKYIFENTLLQDSQDVLANLLLGCISIIRNVESFDGPYELHIFLNELEDFELKIHESIMEKYGTFALFDMMSRQAAQSTEKVIN